MDVFQGSNLGDVDIRDFLWAIRGLGTEQTLQCLHVPESFRSIGACGLGSGLGHGTGFPGAFLHPDFPLTQNNLWGSMRHHLRDGLIWSPINTGSNEDPLLEQDYVWPNDIIVEFQ
ncbi:hypothetical protein C8J57DRAFT_1230805 [Mycena rebaudengoi]|nr:hypothetical protein C8J57DRAFT_1230805 [Mycena rebaudengoi]